MIDEVAWGNEGLAAAVVQDARSARVLMLGWMDRRALARTLETGRVHFWSRSRGELWEKGADSGNWLELVELAVDCDGDALLVEVRPHGPTCHTGSDTCWGSRTRTGFAALDELWATVAERVSASPEDSYTARLAASGPEGPGRKLVEEATETLLAAKDHAGGAADDRRLAEEAADVVYHLMALLAERGLPPRQVLDVLAERHR